MTNQSELDTSPTENTEELEFRAVDAEIDALMSEYGYTWDEPNMRYVNGDMEVSGDFASDMTIRMKKANHQAVQAFGEKVLKEENVATVWIDERCIEVIPVSVITSLLKGESK